ncbi:hypothetical protein J3454_07100 [Erythrobacter sp. NFXS35]|uniref:hypothetical protein n=1 Tax=Erythrobacter sp. NFXS35 TaxID=2818436 RepID=UPI0032DFE606
MYVRLLIMMALAIALLPSDRARAAQASALPDELALRGDAFIEVLLNGAPVRLEVSAEAFGPPIVNPDLAARLQLVATGQRGWLFGPVSVPGWSSVETIDFGAGAQTMTISWADRPVSTRADGLIGVHNLPHKRITFELAAPVSGERTHIFTLARAGGRNNARLGTEVTVGKRRLMMVFVPERAENLITAPTANFIATHLDGGFVPGSDGTAIMDFAVERPTRTMRIARPLELGELLIDKFAVRVEDYGDPKRVGEIGENDPRFRKGQILVSRRKGRGKPDLLTRIGHDQIAHCSRLTYDVERREIRLFCADRQE